MHAIGTDLIKLIDSAVDTPSGGLVQPTHPGNTSNQLAVVEEGDEFGKAEGGE